MSLGEQGRSVEVELRDGMAVGSFELPAGSLAARYLASLAQSAAEPPVDLSAVRTVVDCEPADRFLTVLTRTCGDRPELLSQALDCLAAQDCGDFELLIIAHNAAPEAVEALSSLVGSLESDLASRTRLVAVDGGGRARPLNIGFALARTPYVAALDDDDLASASWVSTFAKAAAEHDGAIVHAHCHAQRWERQDGEPRAVGALDATYCAPFDAVAQTAVNRCPIMTLAYPRYVFDRLGLRFDESLTTNEDWDFLMRAASVCGVVEAPVSTATYRLWQDAANSYSLHDGVDWDRNRQALEAHGDAVPLLLEEGSFSKVARAYDAVQGAPRIDPATVTLYLDTGEGFSQDLVARPGSCTFDALTKRTTLVFEGLERFGSVRAVRIDPGERALVTLTGAALEAQAADGTRLALGGLAHNGIDSEDGAIVFLQSDPQVTAAVPGAPKLSALTASFGYLPGIDPAFAQRLAKKAGRGHGLFGRR